MRTLLIKYILVLSSFLFVCSFAQGQVKQQCGIKNTAFQTGEEIRYKLYYNWNFVWVPAGEVVFTVQDLDGLTRLKAEGKTYKSYEWFFKVDDVYESYVDPNTMLPNVSVRDIEEGNFTLYDRVEFDRNSSEAYSKRGKSKAEAVFKEPVPIQACVHDMLSIIYFARNLDYEGMDQGDVFPVSIFLDNEIYPLEVRYRGVNEKKKIKGLGNFETYLFSPATIAGDVFKEGDEMKVWVSRDENRLPLLIESPISVGSVKAVLMDYKGLRYPAPQNINQKK